MPRTKEQMRIAKKLLKKPKGKFTKVETFNNPPPWLTRAYQNNRYVVMIDDFALMTGGIRAIKAMVQRHDDMPFDRHWSEMQEIKNEIFGREAVGIEYYPADNKLMDVANVYWLWILPTDVLPLCAETETSITCPSCDRVSHHKADIKNQYCGACGFHADLLVEPATSV